VVFLLFVQLAKRYYAMKEIQAKVWGLPDPNGAFQEMNDIRAAIRTLIGRPDAVVLVGWHRDAKKLTEGEEFIGAIIALDKTVSENLNPNYIQLAISMIQQILENKAADVNKTPAVKFVTAGEATLAQA
jgi:hypothetical protein